MLLNDFFTIQTLNHEPGNLQADIAIRPDHPIFDGHFPGQPVVPGVCMISMLKEVMQVALNQSMQLVASPSIKFLTMFTPSQTTTAHFSVNYSVSDTGLITINATLSGAEVIFFKFNGSLQAV